MHVLLSPSSKDPAAHGSHAVWSELATEPPPHAVHAPAPIAEYQPSGHAAHCWIVALAPDPDAWPYSPAAHTTHVAWSALAAWPLAHVAQAQGVYVAERLAGEEAYPIDYLAVPRATYCSPQVASMGLSEREAAEQGRDVKIGKFSFQLRRCNSFGK